MAPKNATEAVSARDMELVLALHRSMKSKPEVDIDKFAAFAGLGTISSARTTLSRLLTKLSTDTASPGKGAEEGDAPATPTSTKKRSGGRKRKTDAVEGDATEETPSKERGSPTMRKGKKNTEADGDDQDSSPYIKAEKDIDGEDDA